MLSGGFLEGVWMVSGGFLEIVLSFGTFWKVSGKSREGTQKVSGRSLEDIQIESGGYSECVRKLTGKSLKIMWKVLGKHQNHSVCLENFGMLCWLSFHHLIFRSKSPSRTR